MRHLKDLSFSDDDVDNSDLSDFSGENDISFASEIDYNLNE